MEEAMPRSRKKSEIGDLPAGLSVDYLIAAVWVEMCSSVNVFVFMFDGCASCLPSHKCDHKCKGMAIQ